MRAGVPREYFFDDLDPEVASAMEHALRGIKGLVAELKDVQLNAIRAEVADHTEGLPLAEGFQDAVDDLGMGPH